MNKQELKSKIEKLEKGLASKVTPENLKASLKTQKEKFEKELADLEKKASKDKTAMSDKIKALKDKVKSKVSSISRDGARKAKAAGKRVSADGSIYYEKRANRTDSQTKKKPYLEKGGYMAKGGVVKKVPMTYEFKAILRDEDDNIKEKKEFKVKATGRDSAYNKAYKKYPKPYFVELYNSYAKGGDLYDDMNDDIEFANKKAKALANSLKGLGFNILEVSEADYDTDANISLSEKVNVNVSLEGELAIVVDEGDGKFMFIDCDKSYATVLLKLKKLEEKGLLKRNTNDGIKLTLSDKDSYDYTYTQDGTKNYITFAFGQGEFQFEVKKISKPLEKYKQDILDAFVIQGVKQHDYKGGFSEAIKHLDTSVVKESFEKGGYMAEGGALNLEIRKLAQSKGLTPAKLGKDYEFIMAQAVVEALTDANYHSEARKLISILENKPEWAESPNNENKPEFGTPAYTEWRKSSVYSSEYYDADEKTRDFAIEVSQKSGWDGHAMAKAFEYLLKIEGGYHKLAKAIAESMKEDNTMEKGGSLSNEEYDKLTREYDKLAALAEDAVGEEKEEYKRELEKVAQKIHREERGYSEGGSKGTWDSLDFATRAKVLESLFRMDNGEEFQIYEYYNSINEFSYTDWDKLPKNIKKAIENYNGNKMAKGGITFAVGQSVIYPLTNNNKLDKSVLSKHNEYANKELVIEKIEVGEPYNSAKVFVKSTGGKVPFDLILNPRYLKHYANDSKNNLDKKIKEYYINEYPTDDLGEDINPKATFSGLSDVLDNKKDAYHYIGVSDSLVRERIFEKLSNLKGVDYDVIYQKWLDSDDEYAKGGETSKNISVFGYDTLNFDMCPLAIEEFEKAVASLEEGADAKKVALSRAAMYLDDVLGVEKKAKEDNSVSKNEFAYAVNQSLVASSYNYAAGLEVNLFKIIPPHIEQLAYLLVDESKEEELNAYDLLNARDQAGEVAFKNMSQEERVAYAKELKNSGLEFEQGGYMANGGIVKYYDKENEYKIGRPTNYIEKEILSKVKHNEELFVGSFGWTTSAGKNAEGYLYNLNEFDKHLVGDIKLKQGEKIFRYFNRTTAIGGITPLIKINVDKALLYFDSSSSSFDVSFDTKGVKANYIALIAHKMGEGGYMAKGGSLDKLYRFTFNNYGIKSFRDLINQGVFKAKFITINNAFDFDRLKFHKMLGTEQSEYVKKFNKKSIKYNLVYPDDSVAFVTKEIYDYADIPELEEENYYIEEPEVTGYFMAKGGYMAKGGALTKSWWENAPKEVVEQTIEYYSNRKKLWNNKEIKLNKKEVDEIIKVQEIVNELYPEYNNKFHSKSKGNEVIKFKVGDKVKIDYISDSNKHNGEVGKILWLNEVNFYPKGDYSKVEKKTQAEITYNDGSFEMIDDLYRKESGLVSAVKKVKEEGGELANGAYYLGKPKKEGEVWSQTVVDISGDSIDFAKDYAKKIKEFNATGKKRLSNEEFAKFLKEDKRGDNLSPEFEKWESYADGGMIVGRWYKDNQGVEHRYIGEDASGKSLFSDGERVSPKSLDEFETKTKESKLFGLFEEGGEMAEGGKIEDIDMDKVESSAKFYTDDSRWSVKPTIAKFQEEIKEYEATKKKLDNKEISPSKVIGTGFKTQYARPLAYKWLNERILIAKRAIEILKERGQTMAKGGKVTFDDKVKSIKASLLKTKKVSPKVQKDYGKTYNAKEAEQAAKRIAGAMRKKVKK